MEEIDQYVDRLYRDRPDYKPPFKSGVIEEDEEENTGCTKSVAMLSVITIILIIIFV